MNTRIIKVLLVWLISAWFTPAQAQDQLFYKLRGDMLLQECDEKGATTGLGIKTAPAGAKFTIVGSTTTDYIIRFWRWGVDQAQYLALDAKRRSSESVPLYRANLNSTQKSILDAGDKYLELNVRTVGGKDQPRLFLIPKTSIGPFATVLVPKWAPNVGAVVLPFKFRPQDNDFTKDLSITGLGGIKRNYYNGDFSLTLLLGIGLASVVVDSINTKGKVHKAQDRSAISVPLGVVMQWERLQMGLFGGFDWLSKRSTDNWVYQHKPWLSLGVGVSIFSEGDVKKEKTQ